jgi:phage terminase small subunit
MNDKQRRFVAEYRKDLNATRAYIAAGYSPKGASQSAEKLLRNAEIAAAVAEKTQQQLEKADLTAERVLEELRRLAFADIRSLFDEHGNLKPLHELTQEQAACIGGFEVIKKNAEAGDGKIDTVHKVKVIDKTRTLEMLAKHFALLTERIEHTGEIQIAWQE